MAEMITVTAKRAHRSGYAPGSKIDKGGTYQVPADRVPSLVRQKLIVDPAAKPKGKAAEEPATEPAAPDGEADS